MLEARHAPEDQVGQIFPDRVGRGRATGKEIVDAHDLVDRIDLVEQQRQFGIVGNARPRRPGRVDLVEHLADVEMIAHRGQAAVDRAGADRDQDLGVGAQFAQHMHVLRVADAALDQRDVARAAMLDVGERRAVEFGDLRRAPACARRCRAATCGSRSSRRARSSRSAPSARRFRRAVAHLNSPEWRSASASALIGSRS